ncbi:MAG TPA: DUF3243 domain-containing protein [Symbiobacteriaceae bacterium]|nr:DUF3243 domain-containing protein [Symbiobacteriaceae bacterium]
MEMQTPVLENFDQWKSFLSQQISNAKQAGASEENIVNAAERIGHFLADKVDPRNREQRLLKELWDRGDHQERHALMSMLTKMLSDGKVH